MMAAYTLIYRRFDLRTPHVIGDLPTLAVKNPVAYSKEDIMESRDSISDIWGPRTGYHGDWPQRVDTHTVEEPAEWVQSACVLCSIGCGMDIGVKEGRIVGVRGRADKHNKQKHHKPKGLH